MAYCSKLRVCISWSKSSQLLDPDIPITEDFDFSEALESVYPLLEMVFSYLDYKDLQTASLVKKSWQVTAKRVLSKRNSISWITVFRKKRQSYIEYSSNYHYNNVSIGIVLFNHHAVSLNDSLCWHEKHENHTSSKKIKFSEFLADQVVPHVKQYCVIGCPGVKSAFSNKVAKTANSVSIFDGVFIPPIPNVRVSMFYGNPIHLRDDYVLSNERLKCLLLFCKSDLEDCIYNIIEHLIPKEDCKSVAIGGGIIRRSLIYPECSKLSECYNLCITFTEDIHTDSIFNAYSIVINGNNLSSEDIEQQLIEFKNKIIMRNNSMAFRICCAAKMRKNRELTIFNKVFPNVTLLGLEAEGEIGWNSYNLETKDGYIDEPKKRKESYPIVQHQWSTVIVFITWGHVIQKS